MKPYTLPEHITQGIHRFLHATGLAYASLDFIVDEGGEHIFLEANQQGQFLWMEDRAGMPVLDVFSQYLIAGQTDFRPQPCDAEVTWLQFKEIWEAGLKNTIHKHALARDVVSVPDYV
jgi:hypothetical protein